MSTIPSSGPAAELVSVPAVRPGDNAVAVGLVDGQSFALAQRVATMLSQSDLMPQQFRNNVPNCIIALNMAHRMGADPLMVAQNLYVVHGRPGWSAQFLIACFNQCGRFSSLRYEFVGQEGQDEWGCRAWAIEKETGARLDGTTVTIGMSKAEGWHGKQGSKWKTMPQQMLQYRAASWFVRAYAPEIAMGLQTKEELRDTWDLERDDDGAYSAHTSSADDLNAKIANGSPKKGRPSAAELEARRASAREAWAKTGRDIKDAEALVNAFADKWSTAQCEKVEAEAENILDEQAAEAVPVTVTCPDGGAQVRPEVECAKCDKRAGCPEMG